MTLHVTHLEFLLTASLLAFVLWTGLSVLIALLHLPLRCALRSIAPSPRRALLALISLLPLLIATAITALVLVPVAALTSAHCHETLGCIKHSPAQLVVHSEDPLLTLACLLAAGILLFRIASGLLRHHRVEARLRAMFPSLDADGFWRIDSGQPLALSAGLWRGRIFLSSGLVDALDADQVRIVTDHESAHLRHRDNLVQFAASLLFCPLSTLPAKRVLDDLRHCAELIADREAAQRSSPERVAGTLVRVHRLGLQARMPELAHFHPSSLELRIHELLEARHSNAATRYTAMAAFGFAVLTVLAGINTGHHLLEAALEWVRPR